MFHQQTHISIQYKRQELVWKFLNSIATINIVENETEYDAIHTGNSLFDLIIDIKLNSLDSLIKEMETYNKKDPEVSSNISYLELLKEIYQLIVSLQDSGLDPSDFKNFYMLLSKKIVSLREEYRERPYKEGWQNWEVTAGHKKAMQEKYGMKSEKPEMQWDHIPKELQLVILTFLTDLKSWKDILNFRRINKEAYALFTYFIKSEQGAEWILRFIENNFYEHDKLNLLFQFCRANDCLDAWHELPAYGYIAYSLMTPNIKTIDRIKLKDALTRLPAESKIYISLNCTLEVFNIPRSNQRADKQAYEDENEKWNEKFRKLAEPLKRSSSPRKYVNCYDYGCINFGNADLSHTILIDFPAGGTNLEEADYTGSAICETNLSFANMQHANLTETKFDAVKMYRTNLSGAIAKDFLFNQRHISAIETNFTNVHFESSNKYLPDCPHMIFESIACDYSGSTFKNFKIFVNDNNSKFHSTTWDNVTFIENSSLYTSIFENIIAKNLTFIIVEYKYSGSRFSPFFKNCLLIDPTFEFIIPDFDSESVIADIIRKSQPQFENTVIQISQTKTIENLARIGEEFFGDATFIILGSEIEQQEESYDSLNYARHALLNFLKQQIELADDYFRSYKKTIPSFMLNDVTVPGDGTFRSFNSDLARGKEHQKMFTTYLFSKMSLLFFINKHLENFIISNTFTMKNFYEVLYDCLQKILLILRYNIIEMKAAGCSTTKDSYAEYMLQYAYFLESNLKVIQNLKNNAKHDTSISYSEITTLSGLFKAKNVPDDFRINNELLKCLKIKKAIAAQKTSNSADNQELTLAMLDRERSKPQALTSVTLKKICEDRINRLKDYLEGYQLINELGETPRITLSYLFKSQGMIDLNRANNHCEKFVQIFTSKLDGQINNYLREAQDSGIAENSVIQKNVFFKVLKQYLLSLKEAVKSTVVILNDQGSNLEPDSYTVFVMRFAKELEGDIQRLENNEMLEYSQGTDLYSGFNIKNQHDLQALLSQYKQECEQRNSI